MPKHICKMPRAAMTNQVVAELLSDNTRYLSSLKSPPLVKTTFPIILICKEQAGLPSF